jgi:hypothetical protein
MPKFTDIRKFTTASYSVTVDWPGLERHIAHHSNPSDGAVLDLDPDFQRAHVWDDGKRAAYVEFILRNGQSARDLLFNCVGWNEDFRGPYVIVDGKQRLEAVRRFMRNDLAITLPEVADRQLVLSDFEDRIRCMTCYFNWKVNDLPDRASVLRWYLEINSGGVVHTAEELERVRRLLAEETR